MKLTFSTAANPAKSSHCTFHRTPVGRTKLTHTHGPADSISCCNQDVVFDFAVAE